MNDRKHHWPPELCYYCGKESVAGCDGVDHFNGIMIDGVPRMSMKRDDSVVFCHRPLCEDHATQIGMTTAPGYVDTIDYCPKHLLKKEHNIDPEIICK